MSFKKDGVQITDMFAKSESRGAETFDGITGPGFEIPYSTSLDWEKANTIGISKNGVDLGSQLKAKYIDYTASENSVTIPTGVNQLKVFCIGGGGGGSAGTVNQSEFRGRPGQHGQYNSSEFNKSNNTYSVTVGNGGAGGRISYDGLRRFFGLSGNQTTFSYVNSLTSNGGLGG